MKTKNKERKDRKEFLEFLTSFLDRHEEETPSWKAEATLLLCQRFTYGQTNKLVINDQNFHDFLHDVAKANPLSPLYSVPPAQKLLCLIATKVGDEATQVCFLDSQGKKEYPYETFVPKDYVLKKQTLVPKDKRRAAIQMSLRQEKGWIKMSKHAFSLLKLN